MARKIKKAKPLSIILLLILFFGGCSAYPQIYKTIEGTVEFIYEKDTMDLNRYWLVKSMLSYNDTNAFLVSEYSLVSTMFYFACDSMDSIRTFGDTITTINSIYEFPQFQDINNDDKDFYKHYGGDVYILKEGGLIISFIIKAKVLILNKQPCESFKIISSYNCPVKRTKDYYRMVVLNQILESKSLSDSIVLEKDFKAFDKDYFNVGYCD
jgi:hypothetical protein